MYKELLAAAAIVLTFVAFVPYVRSILAGQTKPHAFSWIVWGLGTFVVFLAQLADHGGLGAWPTGVSGLITAGIAVLAYRGRADTSITKVDWAFLAIALAALPCWLLTSNPLVAVVLLTGMDLAGFVPTFRVAFLRPRDEHIGFIRSARFATLSPSPRSSTTRGLPSCSPRPSASRALCSSRWSRTDGLRFAVGESVAARLRSQARSGTRPDRRCAQGRASRP